MHRTNGDWAGEAGDVTPACVAIAVLPPSSWSTSRTAATSSRSTCIQVDHTITEEITGIDIVAAGATLAQLSLTQDRISTSTIGDMCIDKAREALSDRGFTFQSEDEFAAYEIQKQQGLSHSVLVKLKKFDPSSAAMRQDITEGWI